MDIFENNPHKDEIIFDGLVYAGVSPLDINQGALNETLAFVCTCPRYKGVGKATLGKFAVILTAQERCWNN